MAAHCSLDTHAEELEDEEEEPFSRFVSGANCRNALYSGEYANSTAILRYNVTPKGHRGLADILEVRIG